MVYIPFPHQQKLIDEVYSSLDEGVHSIMVVSPAGSGKSVMIATIAKNFSERKKRVLFMVHRRELVAQITESLEKNEVGMDYVEVSSVLKIKNQLENIPKPDLIITDETHHSKANSYMEIYKFFSDVPRLGFTATPTRLSGEGFEDVYEKMIEGESVKWLIENHYLAPFEYYSLPMLDRSKLKKSKGEFTNKSIDEALSGTKIYGKIVQTYQEKANGEQAILYAHSVEYSKYFAEAFNNAGIKAVHADSNTPQGERDAIMEGFKNKEFQILCNVDLISEGFNVPDCSTVILLRPTQSLTVFVQQSMRGMRYVPNKKATIIDHVGNYLKHGLPDTERIWTLMGKEQVQPKLSICPNCHSIFENWNQEISEFSTTYTCPCCGHSFTEYKYKSKTKGQKSEKEFQVDRAIEKIIGDEMKIIALKQLASADPVLYRQSVFALSKIFVARYMLEIALGKDKPFENPITEALEWYFDLNFDKQKRWRQFNQKETAFLEKELQKILVKFGRTYQLTIAQLHYYVNKLAPEYRIRSIFK